MKRILLLVDERISEKCFSALEGLGYFPIRLPKMPSLPSPIASHTDILSFKLYDKIFFSRKYYESFKDSLSDIPSENIIITNESQGEEYPLDAIFNGLLLGNKLFCKKDTFSREILAHTESLGIKTVCVKQGYPACTTLKISENAVITADRGMAKALSDEGISVLEIENGGISLPPYEYGFIGGAAALYRNEVYFLGDISTHPDADKILRFIKKNEKKPIFLSDEPLVDLGGMIFI